MNKVLVLFLLTLFYGCGSQDSHEKEGSEYEHMSLLEDEEEWTSDPEASVIAGEPLLAPQEVPSPELVR